MGAFYGSIHIRTKSADSVSKALARVAKEMDCKFLLGPQRQGWISVFPDNSGQNDGVSARIAEIIPEDIFHLILHDDDVFIYKFYRKGGLVDYYNCCPDYFGGASEAEKQACRGRPELFKELLPGPESLNKIKALLAMDKGKFVFESERMTQFVEMLGLENALSSYEYLQAGERDDIDDWEEFVHIENQPGSAEEYNQRGEYRFGKGDLDGALGDFNEAIKLNPQFAVASANIDRVALAKDDQKSKMAQFYNNMGRQHRAGGDLDQALGYFNMAIKINPHYAEAFNNRGLVRMAKGDVDAALADFDIAIEKKPDLSAAYVNRADNKRDRGMIEDALIDYNKAIELKPGSATAHNNRGQLKRMKKDFDGAIADFSRAIELKPDSAVFYSNRALAKLPKKDLDGAFADCNRAIELKPDLAPAYNNRGMVKRLKGDLPGALDDYNNAVRLNPKVAEFKINRDKAAQLLKGRNG